MIELSMETLKQQEDKKPQQTGCTCGECLYMFTTYKSWIQKSAN